MMRVLTDMQQSAIVLIISGFLLLVNVPMWIAKWAIPGVEDAPSFGKANMMMMIIGGVSLVLGVLNARRGWRKPKPN
jgi:hypothetical protein